MGKYVVTIVEELSMDVEIDAESAEDAAEKAERAWKNSEYVLDADHFKGVDFYAKEKEAEE